MNNKKISSQGIRILIGKLVVTLEHFLAILVLLGTVFYLIFNIDTLIDSINQEIFFSSLANFFLSILIGIEISRFLMTHSMLDLIDIFGFLLARKALIPETNSINILIIIISFGILIYIRKEVCKQGFFNDGLLDNKKNNQVI